MSRIDPLIMNSVLQNRLVCNFVKSLCAIFLISGRILKTCWKVFFEMHVTFDAQNVSAVPPPYLFILLQHTSNVGGFLISETSYQSLSREICRMIGQSWCVCRSAFEHSFQRMLLRQLMQPSSVMIKNSGISIKNSR